MTQRCPNHPDSTPCAVKEAQDAAHLVLSAKTDRDAGRIAIDSLRVIAKRYPSPFSRAAQKATKIST